MDLPVLGMSSTILRHSRAAGPETRLEGVGRERSSSRSVPPVPPPVLNSVINLSIAAFVCSVPAPLCLPLSSAPKLPRQVGMEGSRASLQVGSTWGVPGNWQQSPSNWGYFLPKTLHSLTGFLILFFWRWGGGSGCLFVFGFVFSFFPCKPSGA